MSANKKNSSRRRSKPVKKRSTAKKLKRNKPAMFLSIFIVLMLVLSGFYIIFNSFTGTDDNQSKYNTEYPVAEISTSKGMISVELYNDKAPITCKNFIDLANDGFYDGLVFHRVMDGFMIQGGGFDKEGNQKSSPYGTIELEIDQDLRHVDGAIAMARQGEDVTDPDYFNTATSQFYICDGIQESLDDYYAVFGKVISGMDVVREISSVDTTTKHTYHSYWPVNDVIINKIEIVNL